MPCVVKNVGLRTRADARHHVRHHGSETRPRNDLPGVYPGETLVDPIYEGTDSVRTNVFVVTVELSGAGDSEAILTKATCDQFGLVIQKTDHRSRGTTFSIQEIDRNGITLDGIDVDAITQLRSKLTTFHSTTHHQCVEIVRASSLRFFSDDRRHTPVTDQLFHLLC